MKARRGWKIAGGLIGLVFVVGLSCFIWARLFAGGPVSLLPGGHLSGEVVTTPVADWNFAREGQYLEIESHARFLPYSTGTWFMVLDSELFVLLPRLFGSGLEERIAEDPDVRIRIDGRVYEGRVEELGDATRVASLLGPLVRRTMSVEISGDASPVEGQPSLPHGGIGIYRFDSSRE